MLTPPRPTRRPPRRARVAMLLFVLPMLIYSAATQSADAPKTPAVPGSFGGPNTNSALSPAVYPVVYAVEDLLNPIRRRSGKVTAADFKTIMEQIIQHAACGTWGTHGDMQPFPEQLSLVVSHNEAGHQAVQDFLAKLRRSDPPAKTPHPSQAPPRTETYAVCDLLKHVQRAPGKITASDLARLADQIKQQAVPGTWGPVGEITPYTKNLSLVISHHEAGHAAVKAFLTRLRKSTADTH